MDDAPQAWQGGVKVFEIDLDAFSRASAGDGLDVLDDAERARAARMATPLLRLRFIAAHAATRLILGDMLGIDAAGIRFVTGAHGKPGLSMPPERGLHFNLSHCQGRALLALADTEVGVDIEAWIDRDTARLAGEVLGEQELARFQACLPDERPRELACHWTAKEALLKACGLGLQLDPHRVSINSGGGWHTLPPPADPAPWWLQRIDVAGSFCAYVAGLRRVEATVVRHW